MSDEHRCSHIPGTTLTWERAVYAAVYPLAVRRQRYVQAKRKNWSSPLWADVQAVFQTGSTFSAAICVACGFDADTGAALGAQGEER